MYRRVAGVTGRRGGPRNASDRLRQLLIMLPWLMERGEVPLSEVAERFGLSEREVEQDLELVAMCGLPPYVDEMVDVFVDEGMVFVGVPRLFTRPLRLTAPEGFALLVAARAAMELPGADSNGPLARGLAKLAEALGRARFDQRGAEAMSGLDDTSGVAVDLERPAFTDEIVEAVAAGLELVIDYFSPSKGTVTTRVVVPRHVFTDGGNWYLVADYSAGHGSPEESGARRTFRIDRIESVERTGARHDVDPQASAPDAFFVDAEVPRARLALSPEAQWIIDRYPVDSVEAVTATKRSTSTTTNGGGVVEVVLPVASEWWLSRLLVRLGPHARVLEPAEAIDGARALAAQILAGYGVDVASGPSRSDADVDVDFGS